MKSARVPAPAARRPGSPKTVDTLVRVAASPTTERWSSCSIPSPLTLSFKKNVKSERSEEHTSELQSLTNLVCRLLLEKKKNDKLHTRSSGAIHDLNHESSKTIPSES